MSEQDSREAVEVHLREASDLALMDLLDDMLRAADDDFVAMILEEIRRRRQKENGNEREGDARITESSGNAGSVGAQYEAGYPGGCPRD
jgi:hypothetical protein